MFPLLPIPHRWGFWGYDNEYSKKECAEAYEVCIPLFRTVERKTHSPHCLCHKSGTTTPAKNRALQARVAFQKLYSLNSVLWSTCVCPKLSVAPEAGNTRNQAQKPKFWKFRTVVLRIRIMSRSNCPNNCLCWWRCLPFFRGALLSLKQLQQVSSKGSLPDILLHQWRLLGGPRVACWAPGMSCRA